MSGIRMEKEPRKGRPQVRRPLSLGIAGTIAFATGAAASTYGWTAVWQYESWNPETDVRTWDAPQWMNWLSIGSSTLIVLGLLLLLAAITLRAVGYRRQGSAYQWPLFGTVALTLAVLPPLYLWPSSDDVGFVGLGVAATVASFAPVLTFSRRWSRLAWLVVALPLALVSLTTGLSQERDGWPMMTGLIVGFAALVQSSLFLVGLMRGALFGQAAAQHGSSYAPRTRHSRS